MRTRRILLAATTVLLVVSALSAAALAVADFDLSWWLIGGGSPVAAGGVSLSGGAGQGVAGVVNSRATALCSGFWCAPPGARVHLPVVLK
jgi:hypothetical protein